ncbi:MAG: ribosome biogenesis GTP-binding protein YihA/YsxC [Vampirovibrionales bacterium]|nr:ribosome biogenesis GTP-binding protein YihA/YsxC [Vampirovibrionales bacterium]
MKIRDAQFVKSAPHIGLSPDFGTHPPLPEIAFVGRSNVGKSSLINSLLYRKGLAKTSNTPGKTRLINFYRISLDHEGRRELAFVDLPGYGYAKVSKSEQAQWGKHLEEYLKKRATLRWVLQLVDSRHGFQVSDLEMLSWLAHQQLPTLIVLTKADKLNRHQQQQQIMDAERRLELTGLSITQFPITLYSADIHQGRDELWRLILDDI